jgi:hypothetical protein
VKALFGEDRGQFSLDLPPSQPKKVQIQSGRQNKKTAVIELDFFNFRPDKFFRLSIKIASAGRQSKSLRYQKVLNCPAQAGSCDPPGPGFLAPGVF